MKNKRIRKSIAGLLGLCILVPNILGCSKQKETIAVEDLIVPQAYMEQEIALPECDKIIDIAGANESELKLYGMNGKDIIAFDYAENGFLKEQSKIMTLEDDEELCQAVYGEDGKYYLLIQKEEEQLKVIQIDKEHKKEIQIPEQITADHKGGLYYAQLRVLQDSSIVIALQDKIQYFKPGDETIKVQEIYHSDANERVPFAVKGMKIITESQNGEGYTLYDGSENKEECVYENAELRLSDKLILEEDNRVYIFSKNGITTMQGNGSLLEELCGNSGNSFGDNTFLIQNVVRYQGDFYVLFQNEKKSKLCRYYLGESTESNSTESDEAAKTAATDETENKLTIYSLWESQTIKYAINLLQQKHPDVEIVYQVGSIEGTIADKADYVRALDTELQNQEGPDILMLNGLPTDTYIEKGILENISDCVEPYRKEGSVPEQFITPYKRENNTYAATIRYGIPVLMGDKETIAQCSTLDGMEQWVETHPTDAPFGNISKEEILGTLLTLFYNDIFSEQGEMNAENMERVLALSKNLLMRSGVDEPQNEDISPEEKDKIYFPDFRCGKSINLGKNRIVASDLSNTLLMMDMFTMQRNGSITVQPVGDIYTPVVSVGLNANSNAKDLGKEFITILLSKEAQQVDSLEGFPCNINGEEGFIQEFPDSVDDAMDGLLLGSTNEDGEEGTYTMPLKSEMRQLFQMKEQLKTPRNLDKVMKDLIMQNAQAYFDDKVSEKEAVSNIIENRK